ncbi:MAG: glycosyltransferase [Clostridia bacterium]|nr:glycosyltransferase [Clostridia bacterium]
MRSIVFWREVPLDVNLGAFEAFSKLFDGTIIVVSKRKLQSERQKVGFEDCQNKNVKTISLGTDDKSAYKVATRIIDDRIDAIHIFNGIKGFNKKILDYLIKRCKCLDEKPKIGFIGERPLYGVVRCSANSFVNRIKLNIKKRCCKISYRYLSLKYGKYISVMFVMGQIGEKKYREYGFNPSVIFPYMYCPKLCMTGKRNYNVHTPLKFLYIGRFNFSTKGLDILMSTIDELSQQEGKDRYLLDLVGGYGDKSEEVKRWADKYENVKFIGAWEVSEVCNKMIDYDVCLVPSRFDGWNLTPNEAIYSGVSTIISSEAGSDELIRESGSGIVVDFNIKHEFVKILKQVIYNPNIVVQWKNNTEGYREKISPDIVGKYFLNVIEYVFYGAGERPICPWRL